MKKLKELWSAFGYVPKMFRLVYKTDKLYMFYMICETICFALIPYPSIFLTKYAFDAMENKSPFSEFALICTALILVQLGISLLKSFFNSRRPGRSSLVIGKLYNEFHRHSMEMDYELLAEREIQELQAFAGNFIQFRLNNVIWNFVSLFSSLIAFVFSCALLIDINVYLIVAIIGGLIIESLISLKFISLNLKVDEEAIKNDRYIGYYENTVISDNAAKDLRIFDIGSKMRAKLEEHIRIRFRFEGKKRLYSNVQGFLSMLCSKGIDFAIYAVLGISVLRGRFSIGSFSFAISNIAIFRQYFGKISSTLIGYSDTAKYIEYYNRFISIESKFRKTGKNPFTLTPNDSYTIEFRDVSFRYPGQTDYALHHFNLTVNSKEKISVIGENGAGKSTFVKLLMRLYDPTDGEILINGKNIKEFDYDQYLSIFAPVFQDFKLFAFTVNENISSFDKADPEDLRTAAKKSGIDDKIMKLPQKYDTYFTKQFDDGGVEFSGGEQQKIALARTYFKKNSLVTILDEPTSALDPRAEYEIYKEFNDLIGDNTAFFISHRLASAKFCDKIVVIANQKVCEFGSHAELMARKGYYYDLYNMQASYYK